jgi:hypothetical protein
MPCSGRVTRRLLAIHPHQLVTAHRQSPRDLGVQRAVRLLERDRRRLHPGYLADQRAQSGQVATRRPGKDRAQGVGLLRGRAVIQVQRHPPAAIRHPLRRAHRHHRVKTRQVHTVLAAASDVPGQQDITRVVGGGSQPYAVAADIAVTYLEIVPFNKETHDSPFLSAHHAADRIPSASGTTSTDTQAHGGGRRSVAPGFRRDDPAVTAGLVLPGQAQHLGPGPAVRRVNNFNWGCYLESLRLRCVTGTGKPFPAGAGELR